MPEPEKDQPINIVAAFALLLICQLAGEAAVAGLRLVLPGFAFPGPVAGMALLFVILVIRRGPGRDLDAVSGGVLRNLSLLFVPAAAGVIQYWDMLKSFGLPLLVAVVASTILTLLVTVGVFLAVAGSREDQP